MPTVEKFLGRSISIPEDRGYYAKQGLWAKTDGDTLLFGLTEPFLVLAGGLKQLDWLAEEGVEVVQGESLIFAITGKICYIETPVEGTVFFNTEAKKNPLLINRDPYGAGWLFRIEAHADIGRLLSASLDANQYLETLKGTEGFKNPEGIKGGVSGMCKAVYSSIREQKIG